MGNCIFCKIAAGEIPAVKIYEDELVLAFLDIGPINFGHTLVIPKEHHESSSTIPEATAGRMFHIGSRIGIALRRELDYDAFNLHLADGTAAGQVVPHAHLHVVPRASKTVSTGTGASSTIRKDRPPKSPRRWRNGLEAHSKNNRRP